uniref:toxin-antitoxin system YwqK family antitoxin n=1 Tax=Parabacteroides sp. TaxID=1869337 RepID=UPI0025796A99
MNRKLLLASALIAGSSLAIQAQDLVLSEGQYYTDETQTTPYTGRYTEFYDDGMLKMELYLKDGRPEGTYVIYYPDGKIAEVRSYYHGIFHGEWRTYNEAGQLIGLATYKDGEKDGPWRIWNDKGIMRFEMFYTRGGQIDYVLGKFPSEELELMPEKLK